MGFGIKWKFIVEYNRPPGKLTSAFRDAMRQVLAEVGELWHSDMLPKHFTDAGGREYDYSDRQRQYVAAKWMAHRSRGTTRPAPFVKDGGMRAMTTRSAEIRATSKNVSITMPIPHQVFVNRPDLEFEFQRLSDKDTRKIQLFIELRLPDLFDRNAAKSGSQKIVSQ